MPKTTTFSRADVHNKDKREAFAREAFAIHAGPGTNGALTRVSSEVHQLFSRDLIEKIEDYQHSNKVDYETARQIVSRRNPHALFLTRCQIAEDCGAVPDIELGDRHD